MGHALLVVIIEQDTKPKAIEKRVQELMEPYDVDYEGEQDLVVVPCDCTWSGSRAPDSKCEECGGTGEATMTSNPQETWDWYEPGGRWDGAIRGELPDQEKGPRLAEDDFVRNTVRVRDIPPGFVPWAILTPDGEWHGGGGYDDKDMQTWTREQAAILERFPGYLAVAIDFHY